MTACRAVHDAMPLIVAARVVLTALDDTEIAVACTKPLLGYPGPHGIAPGWRKPLQVGMASGTIFKRGPLATGQPAGDGAYGHSRLRECLLGGASSGVLKKTGTPVLMSR